jgi:hypothetical protein
MGHSRLSEEKIERLGKELYERSIRSQVETQENLGKICAIDVETGDYHVAEDVLEAAMPLHAKHTDAAVWGERIGYNAVYALSGFAELQRTIK